MTWLLQSYKNRVMGITGLGVLFFVLASYLAFYPTYEVISQYSGLKANIETIANDPAQLASMRALSDRYNALVFDGSVQDFEVQLFDLLSLESSENKTTLMSFETSSREQVDEWVIVTSTAVLRGKYIDMVSCIYEIEQSLIGARISGVDFYRERDRITRRDQLLLKLYIQSIVYETNL